MQVTNVSCLGKNDGSISVFLNGDEGQRKIEFYKNTSLIKNSTVPVTPIVWIIKGLDSEDYKTFTSSPLKNLYNTVYKTLSNNSPVIYNVTINQMKCVGNSASAYVITDQISNFKWVNLSTLSIVSSAPELTTTIVGNY